MKTAIRIMAAGLAASLALVSCAKQEAMDNGSTSPADGARTIAVSFANGSTKSALEGLQPKFVAGDKIKVSNGTDAPEECTVSIEGDAASITTELTGALTMVYPAAAAKMNGNAIDGVLVPTVQDGTFASANICKAEIAAGATSATFANQTAIFKLSVPAKVDEKGVDYVVKSLAVKSIGENNIADGSKEITVGDGTSTIVADENGFYYVSVLPGEIASNLYVRAGVGARKLTGGDAITANKMYSVALPVLNGHEYVEITMTVGVATKTYKWATMNVGATTPEDYGHYFAWGETTGHKANTAKTGFENGYSFNWSHCPYNNGQSYYDETYFNSVKDTECPGGILALKNDAANVNWGGSWRMPTGGSAGEFQAMKAATYWAWDATDKGYYLFTPDAIHPAGERVSSIPGDLSKSDALLFFPAAGYGYGTDMINAGDSGSYWSSSLTTDDPDRAFELSFYDGIVYTVYYSRFGGRSVRPFSE